MGTLTVKLPPSLEARLEALVRRRGKRKSVLVREAIERLVEERAEPRKGSVLDLVKDLKGIGDGPRDLSSNPKHMRGYGRK
jgi:Arc/MetJ-type ribon-helix-helix transcriptional regulator